MFGEDFTYPIRKQMETGSMVASAITSSNGEIAEANREIAESSREIAKANREIAKANREIAESIHKVAEINIMVADAIIKGCMLISNGLSQIAEAIEQSNQFKNFNSLKLRIKTNEDWLYKHKMLKQFYEQVNLTKTYIPSAEFNVENLEFLAHLSRSKEIQEASIMERCDPIAYLTKLCFENGIKCTYHEYSDDNSCRFQIVGTNYIIERGKKVSDFLEKYPFVVEDSNERFIDYRVSVGCTYSITEYTLFLSMESNVAKELISDTINFYRERFYATEHDRLVWKSFYQRLNCAVSMDNLITLDTELENYVRHVKTYL